MQAERVEEGARVPVGGAEARLGDGAGHRHARRDSDLAQLVLEEGGEETRDWGRGRGKG